MELARNGFYRPSRPLLLVTGATVTVSWYHPTRVGVFIVPDQYGRRGELGLLGRRG